MTALALAFACLTPAAGTYDIVYTKLSGSCPELKSHQQEMTFEKTDKCYQNVSITKSKIPYTATFDGKLKWNDDGTLIVGTGLVTIKSWWGECQGEYYVNLFRHWKKEWRKK
jgi:hypothetical protein